MRDNLRNQRARFGFKKLVPAAWNPWYLIYYSLHLNFIGTKANHCFCKLIVVIELFWKVAAVQYGALELLGTDVNQV